MAFPTTNLLDDFNRSDQGPPPSSNWTAAGAADVNKLCVVSNQCKDNGSLFTVNENGGFWNTQFGPNQEIYVTIPTLMDNFKNVYLMLRAKDLAVNPGDQTWDGYMVQFFRFDGSVGLQIDITRVDNNAGTTLNGGAQNDPVGGSIAAGIQFGASIIGSVVTAYVNRGSGWYTALTGSSDSTYSAAGYIGYCSDSTTTRMDDFSGGVPANIYTKSGLAVIGEI